MDIIYYLPSLKGSCKFRLRQNSLPTLLQVSKQIHMPHRKNHGPVGLLGFVTWGTSLKRAGGKEALQLTNLIFLVFTFHIPVHIMDLRVFPSGCSLSCIDFQEAHKETVLRRDW